MIFNQDLVEDQDLVLVLVHVLALAQQDGGKTPVPLLLPISILLFQ